MPAREPYKTARIRFRGTGQGPKPPVKRSYGTIKLTGLPESPSRLHFYGKLLPAHQKFVDEFVICMDAVKAAQRSGYEHPATAYTELLANKDIRCAIRERMETVTDLASISAADIRRDLKLIHDADATEISGVWKVPCRHCWGIKGQYQYTNAERIYLEKAYGYGEDGHPAGLITNEFGSELARHAVAAYVTGKAHQKLDLKGGSGYSRTREINPECSQCHGHGNPMAYICDTRHLSEGGRRLFKSVRLNGERLEVVTLDRENVRNILARDVQVGVERKELTINLPRTQEEFAKAISAMPAAELEMFVANMITLTEGSDYKVEAPAQPLSNGEMPDGTDTAAR